MILDVNGGGSVGPAVPPLINNNPPVYVVDINYTKTIDGVNVTPLTVNAVKVFWEVTLSLFPKHIYLLQREGITHPKNLALFTSKEFEWVLTKSNINYQM